MAFGAQWAGKAATGAILLAQTPDCLAAVAAVLRRQNQLLHERIVVALGPAIVAARLQKQQLFSRQGRFLVGFVKVGPIRVQLVAPVLGHK